MDESNIALSSDIDSLYSQVSGFAYGIANPNDPANCAASIPPVPSPCKQYHFQSNNTYYNFYYPNDDTTQYLYESYPEVITPIEGVTNQHFIVWMKSEGLPIFRKLYGVIDSGSLSNGDELIFNITANFEVTSFGGTKSIIATTGGTLGVQNKAAGTVFLAIGSLAFCYGIIDGLLAYYATYLISTTGL